MVKSEVSSVAEMLKRELSLTGAIFLGLGSMVGTGVFVGIWLAGSITGPTLFIAILAAAALATCNALSSAQLAAASPVCGGTYEYGYRYLHPLFGVTAGWTFLIAKSAAAATAALALVGYVAASQGIAIGWNETEGGKALNMMEIYHSLAAVVVVLIVGGLVVGGLKNSDRANKLIVLLSIGSLVVLGGVLFPFTFQALAETSSDIGAIDYLLPSVKNAEAMPFDEYIGSQFRIISRFFLAVAMIFVAFAGYGRIATLGEEVKEPKSSIPRAIVITMVITTILYLFIAYVGYSFGLHKQIYLSKNFPLVDLATRLRIQELDDTLPGWVKLNWIVAAGAFAALLGVILTLILGLSRVALAMARRGDLPGLFAKLNRNSNPSLATILVVCLIVFFAVWFRNVSLTWKTSAFTVLVYYAITNLAALKLPQEDRLYPKWISMLGLIACLSLVFFIDFQVILLGLVIVGVGIALHFTLQSQKSQTIDRDGQNTPESTSEIANEEQ